MRWLLSKRVPLVGDEVIRWRTGASHTRGHLAVGGELIVTDQRLLFVPNIAEKLFGRLPWDCPLGNVVAVGTRNVNGHPFSGGLRHRLRVTHSGGEDLFVVQRLKEVVRTIESSCGTA